MFKDNDLVKDVADRQTYKYMLNKPSVEDLAIKDEIRALRKHHARSLNKFS
jgi:hypothetical protein